MLKQEQQAKAREKIEAREREEAQAKQDLVSCKHFRSRGDDYLWQLNVWRFNVKLYGTWSFDPLL